MERYQARESAFYCDAMMMTAMASQVLSPRSNDDGTCDDRSQNDDSTHDDRDDKGSNCSDEKSQRLHISVDAFDPPVYNEQNSFYAPPQRQSNGSGNECKIWVLSRMSAVNIQDCHPQLS